MSREPQTEAGRALAEGDELTMAEIDEIGTVQFILAIEAEAIAQERERTVVAMENEGVVTWGDDGHRARFLQGADR